MKNMHNPFLNSEILLILVTAIYLPACAAVQGTSEVAIDGKINEQAWFNAKEESGFVHLSKRDSTAVSVQTKFKWFADKENLYLGIICDEPEMDKLSVEKVPDYSMAVFGRNSVEIFIDPTGKGKEYYHFVSNAAGNKYQSYRIEGGNTTVGEYGGQWEIGIDRSPGNCWVAEIRIPLAAFYMTSSEKFSSSWKFNITRNRLGENTTWSPLASSFHESDFFKAISGLPAKDRAYDLHVEGLNVEVLSKEGDSYTAKGALKIQNEQRTERKLNAELFIYNRSLGKQMISSAPGLNIVVFNNISLPSIGKFPALISVSEPNGKIVHQRNITVTAAYQSITVAFSNPFYRNNIYPGQKIDAAIGNVKLMLPKKLLLGAQLEVKRLGAMDAAWSQTFQVNDATAEIKIPSAAILDGENKYSLSLKKDDKILAETETSLCKLAKPQSGSCVYIDSSLNLVMNEKPIFVLGFCGNDTVYLISKELRKKYGNKSSSKFVNDLDGWISIHAESLNKIGEGSESQKKAERLKFVQDVKPGDHIYAAMASVINQTLGNPQALFYYLGDEPECRGISPVYLKYQYEFIKQHDPYHPVVIVTREPARFTDCADILVPHQYLSPEIKPDGSRTMSPIKTIYAQIQAVLQAGHGRIAPWFMPQAFSYAGIDYTQDAPTYDEFRCMVYAGVISGAKGIVPFFYPAVFEKVDLRYGYDFIFEELAALQPFLLQPLPGEQLKIQAENDAVVGLLQSKDGKSVLFTANLSNQPVQAKIATPSQRSVKKWFEFRSENLQEANEGNMEVSYLPYEVKIYTSEKIDGALKSAATFRKELTELEAASHTLGNVLDNRGKDIVWDSPPLFSGCTGDSTKSLYTLCDNIKDAFGFHPKDAGTSWVSMGFVKFIPKFKTLRIYGYGMAKAELWLLKKGQWLQVGAAESAQDENKIDITLSEETSAVKAKVVVTPRLPQDRVELYELEMLSSEKNP